MALVKHDVSEESIASIIRVERHSEVGTKLEITITCYLLLYFLAC
jgi:hypothetical protein